MSGYGQCHSASITVTPQNGLLAAWYLYPEEETRNGRIVLARRHPESTSWDRATLVELGTSSSVGNPVLFYDPEGVLWLHFVLLRGAYWDKSVWLAARGIPDGKSFSRPEVVCEDLGTMIRHRPVFLADGRALMPVYSDRSKTSQLFTSMPPYTEWRLHHHFDKSRVIQPDLLEVGGKLILVFRPVGDSRSAWRSFSVDDGRTWSEPIRLPLPNPLSGLAAFEWNGRVGIVYNNTREHQRHPLSLSWSDATLHEWSPPHDFETSKFEVSYPSFCVDNNGQVHGVYTYNRKLIKYVSFDKAWIADATTRD